MSGTGMCMVNHVDVFDSPYCTEVELRLLMRLR